MPPHINSLEYYPRFTSRYCLDRFVSLKHGSQNYSTVFFRLQMLQIAIFVHFCSANCFHSPIRFSCCRRSKKSVVSYSRLGFTSRRLLHTVVGPGRNISHLDCRKNPQVIWFVSSILSILFCLYCSPFFGEEFQFEIPRKFRYLSVYLYDRDRHLKQDKIIGIT